MSPPIVDVEIRYDGVDITQVCVINATTFTGRTQNGTPGECSIAIKDVGQAYSFTPGKTLELYLDSQREWDGYLLSVSYNYWFEGHTANCNPCPHLTPRRLILNGADRNILFTRRVMFNKAAPAMPVDNLWPAGTTDEEVLTSSITAYVDPTDGIDYTTKIETVASPDPYVEFLVPGPTRYLGELFRQVSESTGAVYYIDPDRYAVYTDVNTPTAPFEISDRPSVGQVGCREVEIMFRADEMVNDAIVWGAGQGVDHIVSARAQDADSIALHGRWQNTGGFHVNLWKPASVQRVADSIVYGSPSSKRGRKDDAVSVACAIFTPGLRVADKVLIESEVFGFSDVLPVREMTITFPAGPNHVRYDLRLSHELDEPWIIDEYWRPPTPPPPPPSDRHCEIISCSVEQDGTPDFGITLGAYTPDLAVYRGSTRVQRGAINASVAVESGVNVWKWTDTHPYYSCVSLVGQNISSKYQLAYVDKLRYTGLSTFTARSILVGGPLVETWRSDYRTYQAPLNSVLPGYTVTAHLTGTLNFTQNEYPRIHTGHGGGGTPNAQHGPEHLVLVNMPRPKPATFDGCYAVREIGQIIHEATMVHGDSIPIDIYINLEELQVWTLSVQIWDIQNTLPVVLDGTATLLNIVITYHPNRPSGAAIIAWNQCYEIPVCGRVCVPAIYVSGTTYRVPVAYIPGSTEVKVDGLQMRLGMDYSETNPPRGEITIDPDSLATVVPDASLIPVTPSDLSIVGWGIGTTGGGNVGDMGTTLYTPTTYATFKAALQASGKRVIQLMGSTIFDGAGDEFSVTHGDVTVDGTGWTGAMKDYSIVWRCSNVIVREVAFRPGEGATAALSTDRRAITFNPPTGETISHIVLDHCSFAWGPDVVASWLNETTDFTAQFCIFGPALLNSNIPTSPNGYGPNVTTPGNSDPATIWVKRGTFYRNLYVMNNQRNLKYEHAQFIDAVNNAIYDWGTQAGHGNPRGANMAGNMYKKGPETQGSNEVWMPDSTYAEYDDSTYFPLSGPNANIGIGFTPTVDIAPAAELASPYGGGFHNCTLTTASASLFLAVVAQAGRTHQDPIDTLIKAHARNGTSDGFYNGAGYAIPHPSWPL